MKASKIQWTEQTWNPIRGCSRVSEGCRNCYAERVAIRFAGEGQPYAGLVESHQSRPRWTGEVKCYPQALEEPARWGRPRMVFVNSMSDYLHPKVPTEFIVRLWATMAAQQQHTFQLLTKRPERLKALRLEPLNNVWVGVSAEDYSQLSDRLFHLRRWYAGHRWLSYEPALGAIEELHFALDWLSWVVVGGESGPGARPMALEWARDVVSQCKASAVPVFVKQLGSVWALQAPGVAGVRRHRAGGNPAEWPEDLRVREWPTAMRGA